MWHHVKPLALCATLAMAAGCSHTAAVPVAPPAPAVAETNPNRGTVAEVIPAGRYSYVNIDGSGSRTWYAIPSSEVKVGQQIEVKPGMEVKNYQAKSIGRTFESIIFSDGVITHTAPLPAGHPPIGQAGTPASPPAVAAVSVAGKVVETIKGGDFTYVRVAQEGEETWLTVPAADAVSVGEELRFLPGKERRNFTSKKLNRVFERIIFSGGVDKEKK